MDARELALLVDLHRDGRRQGPGGDAETERALMLTGLDPDARLQVADIGCGTGASTLVLARCLKQARIRAMDLVPEFLTTLEERAAGLGLADRIGTVPCAMDRLPIGDGELDLIWSEGAIYNIGFRAGVAEWRRHLRPGGLLVVSEITWLTSAPPVPLREHWHGEYPEIGPASAKFAVLEENGYSPIGYFTLPEECWLANYYRPLQARFEAFLSRHNGSQEARAIVAGERREIDLYEQHRQHISYGVYIARRSDMVPCEGLRPISRGGSVRMGGGEHGLNAARTAADPPPRRPL